MLEHRRLSKGRAIADRGPRARHRRADPVRRLQSRPVRGRRRRARHDAPARRGVVGPARPDARGDPLGRPARGGARRRGPAQHRLLRDGSRRRRLPGDAGGGRRRGRHAGRRRQRRALPRAVHRVGAVPALGVRDDRARHRDAARRRPFDAPDRERRHRHELGRLRAGAGDDAQPVAELRPGRHARDDARRDPLPAHEPHAADAPPRARRARRRAGRRRRSGHAGLPDRPRAPARRARPGRRARRDRGRRLVPAAGARRAVAPPAGRLPRPLHRPAARVLAQRSGCSRPRA